MRLLVPPTPEVTVKLTTLSIGVEEYRLDYDDESLVALKEALVASLRDGPGFVDFRSLDRGIVSVLVSTSAAVRFETVDREEQDGGEEGEGDETGGLDPHGYDPDSYELS